MGLYKSGASSRGNSSSKKRLLQKFASLVPAAAVIPALIAYIETIQKHGKVGALLLKLYRDLRPET